jgi:hypothetical protein
MSHFSQYKRLFLKNFVASGGAAQAAAAECENRDFAL